jgi:Flp pilus assembly protein TadD
LENFMQNRPIFAAILLGLAALFSVSTWAADTTPISAPEPKAVDPLAAARIRIRAQSWPAAIDELRRVNATDNADWNNLMGFALRKQSSPDLDGAQRFYDTALKLNPQHRGALEYSGELALMKGNLAVAESRMATLSDVCKTPCEELTDLKKALAKFKANGNRYTP